MKATAGVLVLALAGMLMFGVLYEQVVLKEKVEAQVRVQVQAQVAQQVEALMKVPPAIVWARDLEKKVGPVNVEAGYGVDGRLYFRLFPIKKVAPVAEAEKPGFWSRLLWGEEEGAKEN